MKAAIGLSAASVIVAAAALTTIVSPGRLSLEALALTLLGVAAFSAYAFDVPRFVRAGKAVEDKTTWHKTIALVFVLIAAELPAFELAENPA